MKRTRLIIIACVAALLFAECGKEDVPVSPNYGERVVGMWQLKDTVVTDTGTWTLSYKLELKRDFTFVYEGSDLFSQPNRTSLHVFPPFDGVWAISRDTIYLHHRWQSAFSKEDSIKIGMRGNDVLITYSKGNIFGAGSWNGYKNDYKWIRIE